MEDNDLLDNQNDNENDNDNDNIDDVQGDLGGENNDNSYNTDSDIDDPKYTPANTMQNKNLLQNQNALSTNNPNNNSNNIPVPNPIIHQEILVGTLQGKIRDLKANSEMRLKNTKEIENENNVLKTELLNLKEKLNSKDAVISDYENIIKQSKERFTKYEQINEKLKNDNLNLVNKIKELEEQVKHEKNQKENLEVTMKSNSMYQDHINDMQNEYSQKEMKLTKKFQEKEQTLRNELSNELAKLTKEIEELRVENGKLKYDLSNLNMTIDQLNSNIEDKEFEHNSAITKKDKEIQRLSDKLNDSEKNSNELDNFYKQKMSNFENDILTLKEENSNFTNEIADKNDKINDLESQIESIGQKFESYNNELKENKVALNNKDIVIEQLKNQINNLKVNFNNREEEYELNDQDRVKEIKDLQDQMNMLVQEKKEKEYENAMLTESLQIANQKIREFNDTYNDKYSSIEKNLYKEQTKNANLEKKYKSKIKQMTSIHKKLADENKSLKDLINEKDIEKEQIEYQYQNEIKNMSLYNNINNSNILGNNPNINNSFCYGANNNMNNNMNNMNNINNSIYGIGVNPNNVYRFEDPKEESQKKTLEEFKRLLNKIDEKLDMPVQQN